MLLYIFKQSKDQPEHGLFECLTQPKCGLPKAQGKDTCTAYWMFRLRLQQLGGHVWRLPATEHCPNHPESVLLQWEWWDCQKRLFQCTLSSRLQESAPHHKLGPGSLHWSWTGAKAEELEREKSLFWVMMIADTLWTGVHLCSLCFAQNSLLLFWRC